MLVLSRRLNEKLLIPCIRSSIQVLSIQGGQVRLGVEAPPEVAVFREEIYKSDLQDEESTGDERPAVARGRVPALLRNRLARLALGLERLQRQMEGKLGANVRTALDQLGDEFDELARIVNNLPDDNSEMKRSAGCAR